MKRLYCLLVIAITLCLTGCGENSASDNNHAVQEELSDMDNKDATIDFSSDDLNTQDNSEAIEENEIVEADSAISNNSETSDATNSVFDKPDMKDDEISTNNNSSVPDETSVHWEWISNPIEASDQAMKRNSAALNGLYGEFLKNNFASGTYYSVVTVADGGTVLCIANSDKISSLYQPQPQAGECDVYYGTNTTDIEYLGTVQSDFDHGGMIGIDKDGYFVTEGSGDDVNMDDYGIYPFAVMEIEVNTKDRSVTAHDYASHTGNNKFTYTIDNKETTNESSHFCRLLDLRDAACDAGIYFSQLP